MIDDVKRAKLAEDLMNNAVLREALDTLDKEIVDTWQECPARDAEGKEELWKLMKTSKKFRAIIFAYIQAGKLPRLTETTFGQKIAEKLRRTA